MEREVPEADPSDEALMRALQSGEDSALGVLMERWELPLKAFLLRLGLGDRDAEDLAQETFVRLHARRRDFRKDARFKSWILTLAANLARNRWREVQRRTRRETAYMEMAAGSGDSREPDSTRLVRDAVEQLPRPLRETVVAVCLEELDHNQAAGILGCTPKAVEGRLRRARDLLRSLLRHAQGTG